MRVLRWKPLVGLLTAAVLVVATAQPAAAAPNDPLYGRQWGLRAIRAPQAWSVSQGEGITIAIVDTGVNRKHEDLAPRMSSKQYDAINKDFDATDLQGHGSLVAGVAAAATNNGKGIAGVAPKAKIMAVRAFGSINAANTADIADAVMWAADNGAQVINLSLSAPLPIDPVLIDLFEVSIVYAAARGSLVVAAAGNSAQPFCHTPAFNLFALCVGASDPLNRLAGFSNYFLGLDVVAPGTGIWSTSFVPGAYQSTQGTSLASPFVAGVGALLMSMGASNLLAAQIIKLTAKDLGLPGYDITFGWGLVDAKAAVDLCAQIC